MHHNHTQSYDQLSYNNAQTFSLHSPLLPALDIASKKVKAKPFDGYFLDEVITFRKKHIENDQLHHQLPICKDQTAKGDKPLSVTDPKMAEQRAKTCLFEYSDEAIRKQYDSLQVQPTSAQRLSNLSSQVSAFKQQQNSFLKDLLSKKCRQKLMHYNYPSNKTISTQISCEKVWLKHKRSLVIHSRSSTEQVANLPVCGSQTEQLKQVVEVPEQRLKLYRKAIVMSLNHKNQTQSADEKMQRIHLNKYKRQQLDRYRKELRIVTAPHQEINQHPISLILHNKTRDTNDFINLMKQRRTNSQNSASSIKSLVKDKQVRVRSINSEYLQEEKRRLMEGLNILNANSKQTCSKVIQLPIKIQLEPVQGLQTKTKKKMMSIFRKIKQQRVHSNTNLCSPDSLSSSMKISSKENLRLGCFNLNGENNETVNVKFKSGMLKTVKEDVKINNRNIVSSLKIFAESKKSRHVSDLLAHQRNKSSSGVFLRQKQSP